MNMDDRTQTVLSSEKNRRKYGEGGRTAVVTVFDGAQQPYQVDLERYGTNTVTFGRASGTVIDLKARSVSRGIHGVFTLLPDGTVEIEEVKSTNGIYLNGRKISKSVLHSGDIVRIENGSGKIEEEVLILPSGRNENTKWDSFKPGRRCVIGRSENCDLVLHHVGVSKRHAEITLGNDGYYYLKDLNSTNGLFLNRRRLKGQTRLYEKDIIVILDTKIIFSSGMLFVCTYRSGLGVDARNIVKKVGRGRKQLTICNDVSLSIKPGELVAIIGGSGAGKTTLMNAISGYSKPTDGRVLVGGEDLYDTYDSLKNIIGYVPQQDIVYDNLTLRSMLMYAAKLRLPDDTTKEERAQRVKRVIKMVELEGKENTMIRRLSGGQKKRASIAVELISDPKLFFLDEPASGLDPGTERNLMNTLKKMTADGKTIILVTHSTLNLQNCDKIVFMGKGGNLCFCGNMKEAEEFFEVDNLVDVYNMITDDAERWREEYAREAPPPEFFENPESEEEDEKANRHSPVRQIGVLCSRYFRLLLNDRQRLLLVLLQAPLLSFLISLVANGKQFENFGITQSLLFALSCSAFWIGTLNAIQEICKERVILRREYMTGLHLIPYIVSKFLVLGLLCLVESILLTAVFAVGVGYPESGVIINPVAELFITTFLTALAASGMGLFASAMFKNPDRAMTVAPILLMPQILFSGLLFDLEGVTKYISWFAVCRWSMEGFGTTANLNSLKSIATINGQTMEVEREAKAFFEYTGGHIMKAWLILLAFVIAFAVISALILRNIRKSE